MGYDCFILFILFAFRQALNYVFIEQVSGVLLLMEPLHATSAKLVICTFLKRLTIVFFTISASAANNETYR